MHQEYTFPFEKLLAYQLARKNVKRVQELTKKWPRGWADLRDHARRSANSVMLNIAEGACQPRGNGNKVRHFNISLGSAGELAATLDTALVNEMSSEVKLTQVIYDNRRVGALVGGLLRRSKQY